MKKTILYDVDGVILNTKKFTDRYTNDYHISPETLLTFIEGPFYDCQIGKADFYTELDKVRANWNFPGDTSDLIEYWFSDIKKGLNKELLSSITSFRKTGNKCFIATNQEVNRMEYLWETAGLNKYFDGYFVSCDVGIKKPDAKYFEYIVKKLKLSPQEVIFFDNDQRVVDAAKKFGIEAYLYTDFAGYQHILEELSI